MSDRGTDTTSRIGVGVTDVFFSRNDWLFREQPLHDWGIDAHVEPKNGKRPTGQLLALQIKTGPSWFASENARGVRHNISDWHFGYWLRHQLPVYIILHDPETGLTIWQKVERRLIKKSKKGHWYIRKPRTNVLDDDALPAFRAGLAGDPTAFDRNHLSRMVWSSQRMGVVILWAVCGGEPDHGGTIQTDGDSRAT